MPNMSKSFRSVAVATGVACLLAIGGCASNYGASDRTVSGVGVTSTVREGVVISVSEVTIRPDRNYLGAATGAVLGGIAGSNVGGGDDERAAGAVAGAGAISRFVPHSHAAFPLGREKRQQSGAAGNGKLSHKQWKWWQGEW